MKIENNLYICSRIEQIYYLILKELSHYTCPPTQTAENKKHTSI